MFEECLSNIGNRVSVIGCLNNSWMHSVQEVQACSVTCVGNKDWEAAL